VGGARGRDFGGGGTIGGAHRGGGDDITAARSTHVGRGGELGPQLGRTRGGGRARPPSPPAQEGGGEEGGGWAAPGSRPKREGGVPFYFPFPI
jgi:hypothetical protein